MSWGNGCAPLPCLCVFPSQWHERPGVLPVLGAQGLLGRRALLQLEAGLQHGCRGPFGPLLVRGEGRGARLSGVGVRWSWCAVPCSGDGVFRSLVTGVHGTFRDDVPTAACLVARVPGTTVVLGTGEEVCCACAGRTYFVGMLWCVRICSNTWAHGTFQDRTCRRRRAL